MCVFMHFNVCLFVIVCNGTVHFLTHTRIHARTHAHTYTHTHTYTQIYSIKYNYPQHTVYCNKLPYLILIGAKQIQT